MGNVSFIYQQALDGVADNSPDIDVTYDSSKSSIGDKIIMMKGSEVLAEYTLVATDIDIGTNSTLTLSAIESLPQGTSTLLVKYIDTTNSILTSNTITFTVANVTTPLLLDITGAKETRNSVATTRGLEDSNYLSVSSDKFSILGTQGTNTFILVKINGLLMYAEDVAKGSFELDIRTSTKLSTGIYDVEVIATTKNGTSIKKTYKLKYFVGSSRVDTIVASQYSDLIVPANSGNSTDTITTGAGNDIIYMEKEDNSSSLTSLTYTVTDFEVGIDTINIERISASINADNIDSYTSIGYNSAGDVVVTIDSNTSSTSGGNIYTITLTGVKGATTADIFSFAETTSTIIWSNLKSNQIVKLSNIPNVSLAGTISNPIDNLIVKAIEFTDVDDTSQVLQVTNLPTIANNNWTLNGSDFPTLEDGHRYIASITLANSRDWSNGSNIWHKTITNNQAITIDSSAPNSFIQTLEFNFNSMVVLDTAPSFKNILVKTGYGSGDITYTISGSNAGIDANTGLVNVDKHWYSNCYRNQSSG